MLDQEDIIGLVHGGQRLTLGEEAPQLHKIAQLQQGIAEARLFNMADKTEPESRLHLRG